MTTTQLIRRLLIDRLQAAGITFETVPLNSWPPAV